jgi:hypothetical protein
LAETRFVAAMSSRVAKELAKAPIHIYRYTFKWLIGSQCRHWPTCSEYGLRAIELNGPWRGFWLMFSRFVRCGPGGTHGVDPVPDIRDVKHTFDPWRYGRWR